MPPSPPNTWLRQWTGPLTSDLVRTPGGFGLGQVPAGRAPSATTSMVCGFCSTGCGLKVHLRDGEAVNLTPDPAYPVNLGMACPKGWEALAPLDAPDRATSPLLRDPATGRMSPVSWERAAREFTARFQGIQSRHGAHSIAFLSTGQICTEEMALLGALFKFGMGGLHCDSNTRQCMATAHVAYKESFGFDAPPYTYADFEESDVLVFVGANPCIAHPILWQRVLRNPHRPALIVLDPRRTETAVNATLHLPLAPKSDLTLLYGLARALIARDAVDHRFVAAHTRGFAEFAAFVQEFTPERACAAARIPREDFDRCVALIAGGRRVSFWWTMGVNQGHESTRTAQAIINLALMTGSLGRPGTGANSITGQCNAMGSRLYANATSLLGGRTFADPAHRQTVADRLGIPSACIPSASSWAYDQIVDGMESGAIRGLWIIGTNPSHSWIRHGRFRELAARLECLVVQDLYATTDTAQHAHLVLPAAGWGEKEGTFINSERRIGLVKKVRRAPGQALSDFAIFQLIARAWGCGAMFEAWRDPESAFQILKRLSAGQPCDITGIRDYRHLDEAGGIQWPCSESYQLSVISHQKERSHDSDEAVPEDPMVGQADPSPLKTENLKLNTLTERRLFSDGQFYTADGRARFVFDAPRAVDEPVDAEYPWILLTGRGTSAQWHTNTRTAKSPVLRLLYPADCYAELNPADARRLGVKPGQTVRIRSRRGYLEATAFITPTVEPGQIFIPMHYEGVNRLTHPSFDPHSRQPSYKHCAVTIESPGSAE
ncbi:MAG: molybdopterin oxidoreductase family protein [Verrucomicrobia bacterium]|nr:molybdopterin oxidoreductase family protein [Verrucomicrobiota bacterium]